MDDHLMSQLDPIMTEIGEWYDANHRLEESKTLSFQGFIEYNDSDIVFSALSIASIVLFEYETDTPIDYLISECGFQCRDILRFSDRRSYNRQDRRYD